MKLAKKFTLFSCLPILFSCSYRMGTPPRQIYSDELKNILSSKKEFIDELTYILKDDYGQSSSSVQVTSKDGKIYVSGNSFSSIYNKKDGICVHTIYGDEIQSNYQPTFETKEEQLEPNMTPDVLARALYSEFHCEVLFSCNDFLPLIEEMLLEEKTWTLYVDGKPQCLDKTFSKEDFDLNEGLQKKIKTIFGDKYNYEDWYKKSFLYDERISFTLGVTRSLDDILPDINFGKLSFRYSTDR